MNNAFSQVIAILLSIFLFFAMPFFYARERLQTLRQYYVLSESIAFVDGICNTGILTKEMYDTYLKSIESDSEIYQVSLLEETKYLQVEEGDGISIYNEYRDENDMMNQLEQEGSYHFQKGDFLKIRVQRSSADIAFFFQPQDAVIAYYGGMVKYEAD